MQFKPSTIPEKVMEYRKSLEGTLPWFYNGWSHYIITLIFTYGVAILSIAQIETWKASDLITIPVIFIISNISEYWIHRIPLHKPLKGMFILYKAHTLNHHHYFTDDAIEFYKHEDIKQVLFPIFGVGIIVFLVAAPLSLLVFLFSGQTIGLLTFATSVTYFGTYETIHLICHFSDSHKIFKVPFLLKIKKHHQLHHNLNLMSKFNFNVSFPLSDIIFRTKTKNI